MTYREMQKVLKEYMEKGIAVSCKLNATKEVLQAEIEKINEKINKEQKRKPRSKTKTKTKSKASSSKISTWVKPSEIKEIDPIGLTYKRNGETVKVTPIANNASRNKKKCELSLRNAAVAIASYSKYIDVRICAITGVIEFFTKKEYSKVLGGWDYHKGTFIVLADLAELPPDLHKAYLDIKQEVIASI